MALRSTVYRCDLSIADLDRGYYADHSLTVARHPSETEERLMVRILAWALNAESALAFGAGLSDPDQPDLESRDLTGALEHWIYVGLPEEKLIRRACSRARTVQVYAFGGQRAEIWWSQQASFLARLTNLAVWSLSAAQTTALARFAERAMKLSVTIQDGAALIACERGSVSVEPARRQAAA